MSSKNIYVYFLLDTKFSFSKVEVYKLIEFGQKTKRQSSLEFCQGDQFLLQVQLKFES